MKIFVWGYHQMSVDISYEKLLARAEKLFKGHRKIEIYMTDSWRFTKLFIRAADEAARRSRKSLRFVFLTPDPEVSTVNFKKIEDVLRGRLRTENPFLQSLRTTASRSRLNRWALENCDFTVCYFHFAITCEEKKDIRAVNPPPNRIINLADQSMPYLADLSPLPEEQRRVYELMNGGASVKTAAEATGLSRSRAGYLFRRAQYYIARQMFFSRNFQEEYLKRPEETKDK